MLRKSVTKPYLNLFGDNALQILFSKLYGSYTDQGTERHPRNMKQARDHFSHNKDKDFIHD